MPLNVLNGLSLWRQGKALCTQGNPLLDPYSFANDAGRTDHHSGSMINEETLAYFGAGVDVNPC